MTELRGEEWNLRRMEWNVSLINWLNDEWWFHQRLWWRWWQLACVLCVCVCSVHNCLGIGISIVIVIRLYRNRIISWLDQSSRPSKICCDRSSSAQCLMIRFDWFILIHHNHQSSKSSNQIIIIIIIIIIIYHHHHHIVEYHHFNSIRSDSDSDVSIRSIDSINSEFPIPKFHDSTIRRFDSIQ